MAFIVALCCVITVFGFLSYQRLSWKRHRNLPPGPPPLPIVSNLFDLPPQNVPEFQHWLKHKDSYGPVSSVNVLGQTLVFIHDREAAHNILGKQSIKTSGRPKTEFGTGMCGFGELLPIQQYNDNFRHARKLMQHQLGTKVAVSKFNDLQEKEVQKFLLRVLDNPQSIFQEIDGLLAATVLKMTYGYSVERAKTDPLVGLAKRMLKNMDLSLVPGAWLVDILPALKYLPEGFPGTAFKETARQWKRLNEETVNVPYRFVCQQMENGTYRPSYVSQLVQQCSNGKIDLKLDQEDENAIKMSAAVIYLGATDTTTSTLNSFVFAMMMFPEVQRKAHEEMDRVVGQERFPNFADREKLPYINAIVQEVHRWSPVAPMGLPHVAGEDVICNGYFVPKGSFIFPAIWWLCHDPMVYTNPDSFDPERFLEPRNELDPKTVVFGFGRRLCPGRHFADSSMFLVIAQILAAFNITKAVDKYRNGIEPNVRMGPGVINPNIVTDGHYDIVPRHTQVTELLRCAEGTDCKEESDARLLSGTSNKIHT